MVKKLIDEKTKKQIEKFFQKEVKVYESNSLENMPKKFSKRPFFQGLPKGYGFYFQDDKSLASGAFSININSPKDEKVFDSEASNFIQSAEKRFNKVKSDTSLFVIDPDIIRGRYALDESEDRSIEKSILEYVLQKNKEHGLGNEADPDKDDLSLLRTSALDDVRAFSSTSPGGVTQDNLKGDFYVSLIVAQNPDKLRKEWMVAVPGVTQRMAKEGITYDDMRRFTVYHEFGHALDPNSARGMTPYYTEHNPKAVMVRYKKEAFADTHAILQLARDKGNTNMGKLLADIRIANTITMVDSKSKKSEEQRKSDLEKKLEKIEKDIPLPKDKDGKEIVRLEKDSEEFSKIELIGRHAAYHTAPICDAAVEYAEKAAKDGSLNKMTDKEILEKSEEIVEKHALSMERMNALRADIYNGNEENPDLKALRKRADFSYDRMPIKKEIIENKKSSKLEAMKKNRESKIKKNLMISSEKKTQTKSSLLSKKMSDYQNISDWEDRFVESLSEIKDVNRKNVVKRAFEEKNELRKDDGIVKNYKAEENLSYINDYVLSKPDIYVAKACARNTVKKTIRQVRAPKIDENNIGFRSVSKFLELKKASMEHMQQGVEMSQKRDISKTTPSEYVKSLNKEAICYNKTMIAEKTAQKLAKAIQKTEIYGELEEEFPRVKEMIDVSLKGKHPKILEDYHLSFDKPDKSKLRKISKTAEVNIRKTDSLAYEISKEAEMEEPKKDIDISKIVAGKKVRT